MLLYLIKHMRNNIAIITRDILKVNNGANPTTFCAFLHIIKNVLNTKTLSLKLEPFKIICFSDRYHAGDPIRRRV